MSFSFENKSQADAMLSTCMFACGQTMYLWSSVAVLAEIPVTPKIIYFYYQKMYLQDQSIQK